MKNNMNGYKTYIGLIITILGWCGFGEVVSKDQLGVFIDLIVQAVGIIVAVYGNYKAHKKIDELGGY